MKLLVPLALAHRFWKNWVRNIASKLWVQGLQDGATKTKFGDGPVTDKSPAVTLAQPRIFHAAVWTEAAITAPEPYHEFLFQFARQCPLWSGPAYHIILAPSGNSSAADKEINTIEYTQVVHIGPLTETEEMGTTDFYKYCLDTVAKGVTELRANLREDIRIQGPLGLVGRASPAAKSEVDVLDLAAIKGVHWHTYQLDKENCFYGPSLVQLAEENLISFGVEARRALWITRVIDHGPGPNVIADSIDEVICVTAKTGNITCLNIAEQRYRSDLPESHQGMLVDQGGKDPEKQKEVMRTFRLAHPVNLHPRSSRLRKHVEFCKQLRGANHIAQENLRTAVDRVRRFVKTPIPSVQEGCESPSTECPELFHKIFNDGFVFDHRSGAICFDAYEWMIDVSSKNDSPWNDIVRYFNDTREVPWQHDRPNYRRVLAAPSKYILRGEDYYANLRNISPLQRLKDLLENTVRVFDLPLDSVRKYKSIIEWKLCLGFLDQLRNAALQFAWFEHQLAIERFKDLDLLSASFSNDVLHFLNGSVFSYYALLGGYDVDLSDVKDSWEKLKPQLDGILSQLNTSVEEWRTDPAETHLRVTKLIRRWREADHPGENLLIALHAVEVSGSTLPPAVGIGWGGTELPLVYRQIAVLAHKQPPPIFAAHYSKYAKAGAREGPDVKPLSPETTLEQLQGSQIIVFDDNALSGRTIGGVIEHLFERYQAETKKVFITRLSGERRYGQMRMKGHGALDPELVGSFVLGHLGETPFSRAWSREEKEYENPIGVFSLARRRILELLHTNSSANRFDREGF